MCLGKYQVKFGKCLGNVRKSTGKVSIRSFTFSNKINNIKVKGERK